MAGGSRKPRRTGAGGAGEAALLAAAEGRAALGARARRWRVARSPGSPPMPCDARRRASLRRSVGRRPTRSRSRTASACPSRRCSAGWRRCARSGGAGDLRRVGRTPTGAARFRAFPCPGSAPHARSGRSMPLSARSAPRSRRPLVQAGGAAETVPQLGDRRNPASGRLWRGGAGHREPRKREGGGEGGGARVLHVARGARADAPALHVGASCRVCPAADCAARRELSILWCRFSDPEGLHLPHRPGKYPRGEAAEPSGGRTAPLVPFDTHPPLGK